MKKLFLAIIITLAITGLAWAQNATAPAKQPTLDELQWKAAYLTERTRTLQAEFKSVQDALKLTQDQIKALTPAPVPKPEPKPTEDTKEKAKKK